MNKLIFISNNLMDIEKAKRFAKKNHYLFEYYSKEEWKALSARSFKKGPKKHNRSGNRSGNSRTDESSFSIIKMPVSGNSIQTMNEIKASAIRTALFQSRGNASKAAEVLQIGRATLYRKLNDLGMNLESMRNNISETEYQAPLKKTA